MPILDEIERLRERERRLRSFRAQYGGYSDTAVQDLPPEADYETGRGANPEDYTPYNPFTGRPGDDSPELLSPGEEPPLDQIQDEPPAGPREPAPGFSTLEPAPGVDEEGDVESQDISMPPAQVPSDLGPGIPLATPPPVASRTPPPVPPMIMRGAKSPPRPATMATGAQFPQEDETQDMIRRAQYMYAADPTSKTEEAVAAALRFQAMRQYRQDVASGKTPAEAMARSAPLMFYGPKNTLGTAAQFMRATAQPKPIDIGGVGYRQGPNGELIPITPPKSNAFDLAEFRSLMTQIAKLQSELDDMALDDKGLPAKRAKLQFLQEQLKALRQRSSTPPQALPGAPRAPSPTIQGPRTTPPPVAPAAPADSTPRVTSKQQFDALPPGTVYIGTNGRRYRKP